MLVGTGKSGSQTGWTLAVQVPIQSSAWTATLVKISDAASAAAPNALRRTPDRRCSASTLLNAIPASHSSILRCAALQSKRRVQVPNFALSATFVGGQPASL